MADFVLIQTVGSGLQTLYTMKFYCFNNDTCLFFNTKRHQAIAVLVQTSNVSPWNWVDWKIHTWFSAQISQITNICWSTLVGITNNRHEHQNSLFSSARVFSCANVEFFTMKLSTFTKRNLVFAPKHLKSLAV